MLSRQNIFGFKFSFCQPSKKMQDHRCSSLSTWTSMILHFYARPQVDVSLISKEASRDLLNAVVSHWQAYLLERMTVWPCLYSSDHGIFSAEGGNMTTASTETWTSLLSRLQRKSWRRWRPSSFYLPYPSIHQAPTLISRAIRTLPNHASGYFFSLLYIDMSHSIISLDFSRLTWQLTLCFRKKYQQLLKFLWLEH